jgi:hypothetical protein
VDYVRAVNYRGCPLAFIGMPRRVGIGGSDNGARGY